MNIVAERVIKLWKRYDEKRFDNILGTDLEKCFRDHTFRSRAYGRFFSFLFPCPQKREFSGCFMKVEQRWFGRRRVCLIYICLHG
jgi:hypothetical protein